MHPYNMVSRILLILTTITFALSAPVVVQEKRQVPEDVIIVLGKRVLPVEEDFNVLWDGWWNHLNVLTDVLPPPILSRPYRGEVKMPEVLVPPQGPADSERKSTELGGDAPPQSSLVESGRRPTISNAPSGEEPQPEDFKPADSDLKGKGNVLRRISGTASGVDTVNAAQMELR
jgi:hypothetical protein